MNLQTVVTVIMFPDDGDDDNDDEDDDDDDAGGDGDKRSSCLLFSSLFPVPIDHSFWTYDGSLTTPPLYESVTWLVLKQPIKIPSAHLQVFRKLHCGPAGSECVHQNFRPPQPIFQRTVQFVPA